MTSSINVTYDDRVGNGRFRVVLKIWTNKKKKFIFKSIYHFYNDLKITSAAGYLYSFKLCIDKEFLSMETTLNICSWTKCNHITNPEHQFINIFLINLNKLFYVLGHFIQDYFFFPFSWRIITTQKKRYETIVSTVTDFRIKELTKKKKNLE